MASLALSDPDFMEMYKQVLANSRWQNQLASGLGIANAGWKTGLGLNLGTLIGRWLGYKFGNYQRAKDDERQYGSNTPQGAAIQKMLGDADLGWQPSPYWNSADYSWQASPQIYNQDWRQNMVNRALPIPYWQPNLAPTTTGNIAPVAQAPTTSTVATPQANPPPKRNDEIVTFDFTGTHQPATNPTAVQAAVRNTYDPNKFNWSLPKPNANANPYAFSATLRDYNPYLRW